MIKLCPVDIYDFAGIELWLTQMGERGWFPKEWDSSWICNFKKGEPKTLRYRLEPLEHREDTMPPEEQVETYKAMGWTYIKTITRMYHIFAAEDPAAPELHTDPVVQSYAMRGLVRRTWSSFIWSSLWLIALLVLVGFGIAEGGSFARAFADTNLFTTLVAIAMLIGSGVGEGVRTIRLARLYRRLQKGTEMPREGSRVRKKSWLQAVTLVVALAIFVLHWARNFGAMEWEWNLDEYTKLSYPQLAVTEGTDYTPDTFIYNGVDYLNNVEERLGDLARVTEITQTGKLGEQRIRLWMQVYQLHFGGWEAALQRDVIRYYASHDTYGRDATHYDPAGGQEITVEGIKFTVFEGAGDYFYVFAKTERQVVTLFYNGDCPTEEFLKIAAASIAANVEH